MRAVMEFRVVCDTYCHLSTSETLVSWPLVSGDSWRKQLWQLELESSYILNCSTPIVVSVLLEWVQMLQVL